MTGRGSAGEVGGEGFAPGGRDRDREPRKPHQPAARPSFAFFEPYQQTVKAGDDARAMTVMARGVCPTTRPASLPSVLGLQITRAFPQTPIGHRLADLLPTTPPEIRRIHDHDGPATDYAGITADVLLAAESGNPRYFADNCRAVADAIPRGRAIVIPRSSPNAANVARDRFVEPFATFFAGALATT